MIDVVIPTFRGFDRVIRCLAALGEGEQPAHHVYIVDDGSQDGSAERIAAAHPEVSVIVRPQNGGFAATADDGLRAGDAPFVVLLNDDAYAEPGFLAAITTPLAADAGCGMVAALMVRPDGSLEGLGIEADATLVGFSRGWGLPRSAAEQLAVSAPLGPSGGAAAYRRAALEQVGYLDRDLGSYNEDLDLALRLRVAGWSCAAAPDAVVHHEGGQSFGARSTRQLWSKGHSRGYLLRKYGILRHPMEASAALFSELGTVVFQLVRDRSVAGARGRIAGWRAARGLHAAIPRDALNHGISVRDAAKRRRSYGA